MMKIQVALVLGAMCLSGVNAFVPAPGRSMAFSGPRFAEKESSGGSPQSFADFETAADQAREAAASFGEDTAKFMDRWLDKVQKGEVGQAQNDLYLIEECLVDDSERCQSLEEAIKQVRNAAGSWTGLNG